MIELIRMHEGHEEYLSKNNHLSCLVGKTKSPNLAGLFNPFLSKDIKFLFEGGTFEGNEENILTEMNLQRIRSWGEVVLWEGYWMPLVEVKFIAKIIEENYTPSMRIVWGYVDGRVSHLGPLAPGGTQSASMSPGYEIWVQLYKI